MRLRVEIALSRAAGRLSRLAGRGGGTTIPGKILATVDPGAVGKLARRLPLGSALISATNGKTTTAAMVAEIVGDRVKLAHNRAGANLVSGVASALLASDRADLGLFEVDEGAFPDIAGRIRPQAVCLGNLFRDQLDRYGELEHIAERWRTAVSDLDPAAWTVVNADDPLLADIARGRTEALRFGIDDPSVARDRLPHAADSKYCRTCGAPYDYAAAYVGHLGDYRCPRCHEARPSLDVAARAIELSGLEGSSFDLVTPEGTRRVSLSLPGLYNVYNALAATSLSLVLGAGLDDVEAGLARFRAAFGRFERITAGDRTVLLLLVKNPAGANEVVRTLVDAGAPVRLLVALNDEIADGRDVSWIWDVDFEPLVGSLAGARRERLAGPGAGAALQVRRARPREDHAPAGPREGARVRGRRNPARRRARRPPHVHRHARAAPDRLGAGPRAPVLGGGRRVKLVVGHLYPEYLNIYADRGNIAVLERRSAWRGIELDYRTIGLGEAVRPGEHDLYYVGGGQDREQALIAPDLAAKGPALVEAVEAGAAFLAVCGGYQLLGRFYRDRSGAELPGIGLLPHHTVAGERRMIGDVLLECELDGGDPRTLAGFENHAGRTYLDEGAEPLGRVVSGFGNNGKDGFEGCRVAGAVGTYLHGPLLPRNPWLADWLIARALTRRLGEPPELDPLGGRARSGGESRLRRAGA